MVEVFNSYLLAALTLAAVAVNCGKPPAPEDIGTNFFLKASKSVPRIGRRTVDYENYFLKASKSIPRIGRRTIDTEGEGENGWMWKIRPEPDKKNNFDKYFKGNERPGWSDLEKIYQEYPGAFQPEDFYPESGTLPTLEPYWKRVKKGNDMGDEEQFQVRVK